MLGSCGKRKDFRWGGQRFVMGEQGGQIYTRRVGNVCLGCVHAD